MKVLGLDLETTAKEPEVARIIELGAVLWDTDTGTPLRMVNVLLRDPEDPPLTEEITEITGITNEMLMEHGQPRSSIVPILTKMLSFGVEAYVAHNGLHYDKTVLDLELKRHSRHDSGLPWIDTMIDVPYPESMGTRKLVYLAAEHGFLNPFAHRAIFDVLTMLIIMQRYPFEEVMHSARHPLVTLKAVCSFEQKDIAKELGYRWKPETRTWEKELRAHHVAAEQEKATAAGIVAQEINTQPGLGV